MPERRLGFLTSAGLPSKLSYEPVTEASPYRRRRTLTHRSLFLGLSILDRRMNFHQRWTMKKMSKQCRLVSVPEEMPLKAGRSSQPREGHWSYMRFLGRWVLGGPGTNSSPSSFAPVNRDRKREWKRSIIDLVRHEIQDLMKEEWKNDS